ncbi:ABC transporter ATP-binding protein [Cohnella sp. 56]|uniref:ABC transporter ATP-binding protein n=1 Tax=Cohnella sp. 56 TaxID=3113722 RepID=UPI0030EA32BA
MATALTLDRLTGGYSVRKPVLHEVSFDIQPGEMMGLIGLNGAGKSTAIKHVLGLMLPHAGEVRVAGIRLADDPERYRASCAYVPEQPSLFPNLTVAEHLRWTETAYGLETREAARRTEALAETFRMKHAMGALPGTLSKGMRQKVMLMNALLVAPPLLIIDEPFLGLDPLATRALVQALNEARAAGSAILLSSHILPALERNADRIVVLHQGRILAGGTPGEVKLAAGASGEGSTLDDAFERLIVAADEAAAAEGGAPRG